MKKTTRTRITSPDALRLWRERYGLTQEEAAGLFFRKRRAYQYIETGNSQTFPPEIDMLCADYEKTHKPMIMG